MKPTLILNDLHLGVTRQSGTTPTTQRQLQDALMLDFTGILCNHYDKDLLIAGDLFDGFAVEPRILLETYYALADWLHHSGNMLYLVAGNHDWSPKADRVSSFHFLARCLAHVFPDLVRVIDQPTVLHEDEAPIYVIPHLANQDLFEQALEAAERQGGKALILHCNIMSPFATHSDHSLDVSEAWLKRLAAKFDMVLFAHEHQHRQYTVVDGQVRTPKADEIPTIYALGNQWPSSVLDCLSQNDRQTDDRKYAHVLSAENGKLYLDALETWRADGDFLRADWRDLDSFGAGPRFIRVEGSALAAEAAEVVTTIAKFRQVSSALVITNAVKVAGQAGIEEAAKLTFDNVKSFNVMDALLAKLDPQEQTTIQEVMRDD